MKKKYIVRLSDEERTEREQVIKKLTGSSSKVRRAQMLLKADVEGPGWTDKKFQMPSMLAPELWKSCESGW